TRRRDSSSVIIRSRWLAGRERCPSGRSEATDAESEQEGMEGDARILGVAVGIISRPPPSSRRGRPGARIAPGTRVRKDGERQVTRSVDSGHDVAILTSGSLRQTDTKPRA